MSEPSRKLRQRLLNDESSYGDSARRRRVIVGDLTTLIADVLAAQPTLLIIEDAHWADELSLDVFERLAGLLSATSSMVALSYRSDELYPRSPLQRFRTYLLEQRLAEEVRLGRLALSETRDIVQAITGTVPSSNFCRTLQERSNGIPLHIEELIVAGEEWFVPETVAVAVTARALLLSPQAQSLAEAASVIGRSFGLELLDAVSGGSAGVVGEQLRELCERHFVVAREDGVTFDFRHALIRDALYGSVPPERRVALHAAVAEAAARKGMRASLISEHYERARQPSRAHEYALIAASDAVRISAHREAAELYRRAQRTQPSGTAVAERADLAMKLGTELAANDENEGAAQNFADSITLHRGRGDEAAAAALVPPLMATLHLQGADLEKRASLAMESLERLDKLADGGPRRARAELLGALSSANMLDRRLDEAVDYGMRGLALATGPDTVPVRVNIEVTVGAVLVFAGRGDEGWPKLEEAIQRGEREGLEVETARGYRMAGSVASVLVDYHRADVFIAKGLDYTARTEHWNDHHYLRAHLAHVRWAEGDWKGADAAAQLALADGRGGITTLVTALHVLGYLALGRGEIVQAREHLEEAREIGERMKELQRLAPALWGLAELALNEGDPRTAHDLCERGYLESAKVADAAYLFPFVVTGVRALLALHEISAADEWFERCAVPLRARGITGTLPALDHAGGLIRLAEGKTGQARTLLESASVGWESHRRFWEGSMVLVDRARCAVRSRGPGDAAQLVGLARQRAVETGFELLDALASQVTVNDESGIKPLSAREFEVAQLIASGLTNREISDRLGIATKTVSAHVEHILAKLGAARRTEIAAWVARNS